MTNIDEMIAKIDETTGTMIPDQRDPRRPEAPDWGNSYGIKELWTEIVPGLFVGGTADDDTIIDRPATYWDKHGTEWPKQGWARIEPEDFEAVTTLYAYARPCGWGVQEMRWGFMDSHTDEVDIATLLEIVQWTHGQWLKGRRTLVRCQAGLNRSSLIAALVMVREGADPARAIMAIRGARSRKCLFNQEFVRLIMDTPVEVWRI